MAGKKTSKIENNTPTVVVYQNPDFVSGLLQEIFKKGLLEYSELNEGSANERKTDTAGTANAKADGGANIPFLGQAGLDFGGDLTRRHTHTNEVSSTDRKKFVYSQSFFLDQVRTALRKRNHIRPVNGLGDVKNCKVGDFVEFDACFVPNEANVLLDILTPDLTAEIARYTRRSEGRKEIEQLVDQAVNAETEISVGKISSIRALREAEANDQADLAAAIAKAFRQDFRGDTTKEFYAEIGSGDDKITAVAVCESEYFTSKDNDRLLDGQFTVLAKVISGVKEDVSILERNKLLNRLNVETLEELLLRPLANQDEVSEYVNLQFKSTIEGASVTVLPIAVYV